MLFNYSHYFSKGEGDLRKIAEGARAYYVAEHLSPEGEPLARQFPTPSGAFRDTTPSQFPAQVPGTSPMEVPSAFWDQEPWRGLGFVGTRRYRYRHTYLATNRAPEDGASSFTVLAESDLDGDETLFRLTLEGRVNEQGEVVYAILPYDEGASFE